MPVSFANLTSDLQQKIAGTYPDIGQTYYIVNSAYRTAAQGWSRTDRTGPLDLAEARKAGPGGVQYVYRDGDYATTAAAIQAAHDASVAFRGDDLFFTPGAYSVGTAVTITNAAIRLLGQPRGRFNGNTSITATVASALTIGSATPDVEVAFLRFVPLTAAIHTTVSGASNNLWVHDCEYDARGIVANTGTIGWDLSGAALNVAFERLMIYTNTAGGPAIRVSGAVVGLRIDDAIHYHDAGTLVTALLDVTSAGATTISVTNFRGVIGLTGVVTNVLKMADNTNNTVNLTVIGGQCSKGFSTAAAFINRLGVAAEANVMDVRLGQDSATLAAATTSTSTIFTA